MNKISSLIHAQPVSGYVRDYVKKDGSPGSSARVFVIPAGANAPVQIETTPETFATLAVGEGQWYWFDTIIRARAWNGQDPELNVWARSASVADAPKAA